MKENFEKALAFVLKWEGGETYDTGGHTKFGISKNAHPDIDIENLTIEQAKEIYKRDYWDKMQLDNADNIADIIIFDSAVNCGVNRTIGFLSESEDWKDILLQRIAHYTTLAQKPKYRVYFVGWMNRVMDLYREVSA